ncbi:hypothetical protein [Saccharothrix violaceirubra]|uniref:Peptidase inhibitor family I36 n=1 Tax=Saccharothrix violaceirubra TaxID=413306 RepID=A0A7W7T8Y4_9PSEU|nr:hypothetical protein [Saccharothrix violaceirubra]MBB4968531.1 hypothetical protein [Saccharothrix violaceirubra]
MRALLVLVAALVLPGTAVAADADAKGQFRYVYSTDLGDVETGSLRDPEIGTCLAFPGLGDERLARSTRNQTDATAIVYREDDCQGDYYVLEPREKRIHDSDARSVRFV